MDEDSDNILIIDLEDEREAKQDEENNTLNEIRPINDNIVKKYVYKDDTSVGQQSDVRSQVTIASPNNHDNNNSDDDDIQVIDDDDEDYENSVQKLITVANKVGKEYLENKQSNEAEDYRTRKSDLELKNNFVNGGNRDKLGDLRSFHEKHDPVNRDILCHRVARVKENHPTERSHYKLDVYPARYVMDDYGSHFLDKNNYRPKKTDVAYRLQAPREVDMYKPGTINKDDYNASVNRHAYNPMPTDALLSNDNDKYRDATINKNTHRYIYRPEVLSIDDNRQANRETNSYTYGPDVALGMLDYNYRHGTIYRDNNHVYIPADVSDSYNCASMNPILYNHARSELPLSSDHYRHILKRDACSYTHQEERLINDDCRYRYAAMNRFPYRHAHIDDALDAYWKMSRNAYRPEIISLDYDRAVVNRHCSNGDRPALNLDPYRYELSHLYRPDLVNISAFREPMLIRHPYNPEGMYGYIPQSYFNTYRPYDDAHKKDEAILNLSRRPESINTSRHKMDGSKLRNILSGRNYTSMSKSENQHMHEKNLRRADVHRSTTDNIRSMDTALNKNKSEMHINIGKSEVPVRENTLILSTNNVCQKGMSNHVKTDDLATTNIIQDGFNNCNHILLKNIENNESPIYAKEHFMNENIEMQEGPQKNIVIEGYNDKIGIDNNIRFLVVFFTRVKELVKGTFPEFSKSLVREIDNLGQLASNGKVKTDIQFICPLYCSVSTYSLPRLGSVDDDNKIEKHKNRTEICDVCSCIQNCYKLYKKKYLNLLSTVTNETEGNENKKGQKRKIMTPLAGSSSRQETVICTPKITKCNESRPDKDLVFNKKLCRNPPSSNSEGNLYKVTLEHKDAEGADNVINPLNEKTLLNTLSIVNFNAHGHNINKGNNNNQMCIEKTFKKTFNENEEIMNVFKTTVDKSGPDEAEANLILSLSYNEITNADIISSKLKNKPGRRPDAVFTCHICTCFFTYFTSFVSHMQKEHNIIGIDEDIPDECIARKCPFCGIYSKQKLHNEHVKRAHPEIYTHKGPSEIPLKVDRTRSKKRKFIFTCLVCHKNLKSREVKRHREKEHKGLNVAKMFTKKLSTLD